jgi:hypothetical protein
LTQEERTECARNAGIASAAARRKYKTFREVFGDILTLDTTDDQMRQTLVALGLEPSNSNAIALAQVIKAVRNGDTEAARFVRDSRGEKPTEALQMSISDKPIKALDLTQLSDAELEALADGLE